MAPLPTYRETKIITNHGKITRVKWDEGELFNWIQVQDGKPADTDHCTELLCSDWCPFICFPEAAYLRGIKQEETYVRFNH
ncbi:XtrA/YqaO family protein [Bacillus amyloliquefaciens]|uniref:XtrA/YqaO family protein n=1 Tax=Bacillus TaxID=1386 RepID=UPI0006A87774|nr:hypothetical protein [Bacillus sp. H2FL2]ASB66592.1 hypothetical protein S101413_03150 [Bacillus velezensis]MCX2770927.1 hypothetical protein [Bacillus sp. H2FL2]CUB28152.1 hypothetical protein BN2127_JRS5_01860 [Bacillus amyloliquefaciens]